MDICNDSCTSNSPSQSISNILFQLPVTNGNYGALINYNNNDIELSSYNIQSTIYNINVMRLLVPAAHERGGIPWFV